MSDEGKPKFEIVTGQDRKLTVVAPKDPDYFTVELTDWKSLRNRIIRLKPRFNWLELFAGASLGASFSSLVAGSNPINWIYISWGIGFLIFAILLIVMAKVSNQHTSEKVDWVLEDIAAMEGKGQTALLTTDKKE